MSPLDLNTALATELHRDHERAARASRLAALARCCRDSAWGRIASSVGEAAVALRNRLHPTAPRVVCCA